MATNWKNLADTLIDNYCESYGVKNCIGMLKDMGYTKDELVNEFNFDTADVESVWDADNGKTI